LTDQKEQSVKELKVAHIAPATPHRCGLYETARELVWMERKLGMDAHIVDPRPYARETVGKAKISGMETDCPECGHHYKIATSKEEIPTRPLAWDEDREVCIAPVEWAVEESDVIVSHSGLDSRFDKCDTPRIHLAHGRPDSSYRIEQSGETPILSMYHKMADDPRWKQMVTLWPGYGDYLRLLFPNVRELTPFVDLDRWTRKETGYDFDGKAGGINVVCCDVWRMDKDPFHVINAYALFAEKHPEARLHVYAVTGKGKGRDVLFQCLDERGVMGTVRPVVGNLQQVYSAADMVITPHRIGTRIVREALACGCQVVAGNGNPYTQYTADVEDLREFSTAMENAWDDWKANKALCIQENRRVAETSFDLRSVAGEFIKMFQEVAS